MAACREPPVGSCAGSMASPGPLCLTNARRILHSPTAPSTRPCTEPRTPCPNGRPRIYLAAINDRAVRPNRKQLTIRRELHGVEQSVLPPVNTSPGARFENLDTPL